MQKLRHIVVIVFISQILSGCIAMLSPSYSEYKQERVIVIYEPCPIPTPGPIPIERPAPIIVQPIEKPKIVKYREPKGRISADRKESDANRSSNDRVRNSGDRRVN